LNISSLLLIFLAPILGAIIGHLLLKYLFFKKFYTLLLTFSGSFLLSITVFNLLPKTFTSSSSYIGLWIMGGIVTQILLEILSNGIEHGHKQINFSKKNPIILLFISLCLHSILEGIPISQNPNLVWGIFIHKIPVGITLIIILQHIKNKISFFAIIITFSLMTPIGAYFGKVFSFFYPFEKEILGFVSGILLHISTIILFENTEGHKFNLLKIITILIGVLIAYTL